MAFLNLGTLSTSVPTAATDGVALKLSENAGSPDEGFSGDYDSLVLFYRATVTAGQTATMSFLRLWGYSRARGELEEAGNADWFPVGIVPATGLDADRGKLNDAVALGEIGTDRIDFCQVVSGLGAFERVYLQQGTSGGSGYSDAAWLVKGK